MTAQCKRGVAADGQLSRRRSLHMGRGPRAPPRLLSSRATSPQTSCVGARCARRYPPRPSSSSNSTWWEGSIGAWEAVLL